MILQTLYSIVWDWYVSRAGPIPFYWPKLLYPYYYLLLFFPSLLPVCRLVMWPGVFGLIGCISLSLSLAVPTSFHNNYSPWTVTSARSAIVGPLEDEIECEKDWDHDSLQVTHNASPVTTINYWRNCAEGVWRPWYNYWEWHLIPRLLLRGIFARFPEQLLKGLISLGSRGEYSMIDRCLGDAFGILSCQFLSTLLQCRAR